ncbi:hypothetical protein [Actinoallomurus rhizosphaericola]|uniref:hypothetical protein n=1 Tax=Actinoallomurus rhizosphaericola TaxID=2952536 RepID=UPI002092B346|nr:hypothetical protein [Actinoallomurus rhizosphaericola]MCO5997270.1 hypothetical protein [Actinoallomurus rhizosphaericola]
MSSLFRSYIGGFNIPMKGGSGRIDLSRPLARLDIRPRRVSFHPRGLFKLVLQPRSVPFRMIQVAFPVAPVLFSGPGVGMSCSDGDYYFWTRRADEILCLLESAGITVDAAPRYVRLRSLTF